MQVDAALKLAAAAAGGDAWLIGAQTVCGMSSTTSLTINMGPLVHDVVAAAVLAHPTLAAPENT
jgi:hypothetical protein